MSIFLTLLLLPFVALADSEFCFPTQRLAMHYQMMWQHKSQALMIKLLMAKKVSTPVMIQNSRKCDSCLVLTGDSYIIGILGEEFEEKRKEFEKMLEEKPVNIKVDVSMGRLYPDEEKGEQRFFNKLYRPFLRYPGSMQNAFYDSEGTPIFVSAEMRNPEIIIYTFLYKDMKNKVVTKVDDPVGCMFPHDEETKKKYPLLYSTDKQEVKFFMQEDDKKLVIKEFLIISIKRDFYWPQERIFQSN
jgi:hypothetical protein